MTDRLRLALERLFACPNWEHRASDWKDVNSAVRELHEAFSAEPKVRFSIRNRVRCEAVNGFNHKLNSWSLSDWMTATAGELGEAANIIKKLNRVRDGVPGNRENTADLKEMLAEELADVFIYLDLLTQAAGFELEKIRDDKFAKTSKKIGYVPN